MRRLICSMIATGVCFVTAPVAADEPGESDVLLAQGQPDEEADVEAAGRQRERTLLEEIVVTARKREENLQQTPISVTALGATDLEDIQARRLDDIGQHVPNLQLTTGSEGTNARVRIRGIGNADAIVTRDPSVGVYVDGVYLARAAGTLLAVSDIERVEVLRGPQGTLFGKNTTGGAVNVITAKPDSEFGASASFRYGNYNNIETRGHLNVPLDDEWAYARLSFASRTRDPLTDNKGPILGLEPHQGGRNPKFDNADDKKMLAARFSLRLLPADNLEVMLIGERTKVHQRGRGGHCRYNPDGETAQGISKGGKPLTSLTTGNLAFLEGVFGFVPNDGGMNRVADFRENCEATERLDVHEFSSNVTNRVNLDTWGTTGVFTWDVSDLVALKYTTAWRRYERKGEQEFDWTATAEFGHCFNDTQQHDQLSHELNATGLAIEGRLNWTAGLYAFREKVNPHKGFLCRVGQTLSDDYFENGASFVIPDPLLSFFPGCVSGVPCPVIPAPFIPSSQARKPGFTEAHARNAFGFIESNWIVNNTYAGYAQVTFDLTESLSLTGGVRRLVEKREWTHQQEIPGEQGLGYADAFLVMIIDEPEVNAHDRFDKWTMLANLQYQWTEELMTYFTFSTGYKGGGFNGRVNEELQATLESFEPEDVDSWEIGMKSTWFDRRLVANVSAFYTEYENIQQTVLASASDGSFASVVENAGEAIIRGAEVELRARPTPGLDLTAGLGWTDPDYHENFTLNNDGEIENRRGEEFFNTPNFTMNLSAAYSLDTPVGILTPRLSWYHQSEVNYSPSVEDLTKQGTVGLLSGRLSLELNDGVTEVALWGTNLLDREWSDTAISFDDGFAVADIFYAPPRLFGIEINREF